MGPPPITIYLTTIASQPALRQRQEYLLRILQSKRIPFSSYDLASDEDAKRLWRRKVPIDKQQLPGILVGGNFVGTFQQFEEAVEYGELDQFLKRKEEWDEAIERPSLPVKPIGVPGASLPMEMTPEHIRTKIIAAQNAPSPLKGKSPPKPINKEPEGSRIDVGDEVGGFGLQGVKVTEDELRDLVEQLGLGGDEAEDLVQGLSRGADKKDEEVSPKASVSALAPKKAAVAKAEEAKVEETKVNAEEESKVEVEESKLKVEEKAEPKDETKNKAEKTEAPSAPETGGETNILSEDSKKD